ncbi:MAG: hypothetical protein JO331_16570 [Verrucomicrobia bacterium]|nr:hypothetical protein [Verrucomicrobiota bacterium]
MAAQTVEVTLVDAQFLIVLTAQKVPEVFVWPDLFTVKNRLTWGYFWCP